MEAINRMVKVNSFRSMATSVIISHDICDSDKISNEDAVTRVKQIFEMVELTCSRFIPTSDISRINSAPSQAHTVNDLCRQAISEAYSAYLETDGLFDPRILRDLVNLGYETSWSDQKPTSRSQQNQLQRPPLPSWKPILDQDKISVGQYPIDLGGIGKGLALRWAAESLDGGVANFIIEAGGDCICKGSPPNQKVWNVAIENPHDDGGLPIAVLGVSDYSVCTSSTSIRRWWRDGKAKHHLISPITGDSVSSGLACVSVAERDPASAEIWSKVLFIEGLNNINSRSNDLGLAVIWVSELGEVSWNQRMKNLIVWPEIAD